ncbi:MAG TPA: hypothetical protein VEU96_03825 [Bryobacteraceae bacterium]|nr:hypothetical protein [Bryobacteraceae bacterium]
MSILSPYFRVLLVGSLALLAGAEDRWTGLRSGPFEVLTTGGDRPVREKLMYLEQFRETLRIITGKQEMRSVWPIRVVVVKSGPTPLALGRDARMMAVTESGAFPRETLKELARILLYENTNRLPQEIESGIIELVSTLEVNGTHVTLGAAVPEAERSRGWALMQLVTVNPDYSGRSRVMISNLEQSGDFEAACHNAFQKTAAQINQQADAYLKAGSFATTSVSGRALSLTRDFKPMQLDPDSGKIAMADLLLATGSAQAATAAYTALHGPAAAEGLGLLALKAHKENDARTLFASAIESQSESARAWLELGRLEKDPAKGRADLEKAAKLNPNWAEPYFRMAELAPDNPQQRAVLLKKAAGLEARNIDYWQALARAETAAKNFPEAQKAWAGAERAAANDEERARIHQVRLQAETQRMDFEAAEKKRIAEEQERELQRVKGISDAAIHAAEEEARKKMNADGAAPPKPEGWWEDMQGNASVEGVFQRLDCLGKQARVTIQTADGKTVQLLVRDPTQIAIVGGGEKSLGCGVQKPARKVLVQFLAKPDAKLKTSGEVTSIEFR